MQLSRESSQAGFSLIEVLVSLVIICIGVLGLVALQSRSLVLSQDAIQRNNAIMLAGDLLELMRSNAGAALDSKGRFFIDSPYAKPVGEDFTTRALEAADGSCATLDRGQGGEAIAGKDLTCWLQQVRTLLPVSDAILKANFAVCPTRQPPQVGSAAPYADPDACVSPDASMVMIVLAWQDNTGNSAGCSGGLCFYTLRGAL